MRLPSRNQITMPFGSTDSPYSVDSPHRGTDFSYQPNDTIYAPADGTVQLVPNNGKDGNGAYMQVDGMLVGMLHTSKYLVPNGAIVKAGDPIAIMGDTGYAFGKHLHFAVRRGSQFIDPMTLIDKEVEEIPMFNEGDRVNMNVYLFKEDRGEFKEQVGKGWKTATYEILESQATKMELYFNDGDRGNINAALYGSDIHRFNESVGKTWKGAIYTLLNDEAFKTDQTINEGDIQNLKDILGTDVPKAVVGKGWKNFVYQDLDKLLPNDVNAQQKLRQIKEIVQ